MCVYSDTQNYTKPVNNLHLKQLIFLSFFLNHLKLLGSQIFFNSRFFCSFFPVLENVIGIVESEISLQFAISPSKQSLNIIKNSDGNEVYCQNQIKSSLVPFSGND